VASIAEYNNITCNEQRYEICDFIFIENTNEQPLRLIWRDKKAFVKEQPYSNTVFAIFTTAKARLRLLLDLHKINKFTQSVALYADTDSIALKHRKGLCPIVEGSFLGNMSREYANYNIIKVVCPGPKYVLNI